MCKCTGREEAKTPWIRCRRQMRQRVCREAAAASGAFFFFFFPPHTRQRGTTTHTLLFSRCRCFFFFSRCGLEIPTPVYERTILGVARVRVHGFESSSRVVPSRRCLRSENHITHQLRSQTNRRRLTAGPDKEPGAEQMLISTHLLKKSSTLCCLAACRNVQRLARKGLASRVREGFFFFLQQQRLVTLREPSVQIKNNRGSAKA